jgi:sugar lactone lactonase YvrE
VLGEGPVWDERQQRLYWVDIEGGRLHHCDADGAAETYVAIGERIGCIVLRREAPGFIAGLAHSIARVDLDPLEITELARFEGLPAAVRCNDGKCDAAGRFWVGTYNMNGDAASGWLYRFEVGRALQQAAGPFICTNGPAVSPDGSLLYCVDSYGREIERWRLSADGALSERRVFARFDAPGCGFPDGLTCDAEGCVWVAEWGGARVSRLNPEGQRIEVIELPVAQPTSCTFGGPVLQRLFITSAAQGLAQEANRNGLAGAVFAVDVAVPGLPAARFNG